jgi:hypothetical protein
MLTAYKNLNDNDQLEGTDIATTKMNVLCKKKGKDYGGDNAV